MAARHKYGSGGSGTKGQKAASIVVRLIDHLQQSEDHPPNRTVLDYGCGRGRNIEPFLRSKLDFHVVAAEIASASHFQGLRHSFARRKRVQLVPLGVQPLDDILKLKQKFGVVVALASIHHDFNPREVIAVLQSVTLPGGFHAVLVFTAERHPTWLELGKPLPPGDPYQLTVLSPFGQNELLDCYRNNGWQVLFYEEGTKEDDTRNPILLNGYIKEEPRHFHSCARILAKKIR